MRYRLVLVVTATASLVLVAFLVPLALLVRSAAADRTRPVAHDSHRLALVTGGSVRRGWVSSDARTRAEFATPGWNGPNSG